MSRVAIVTGGTRGIGATICVALARDGYKVAASYVHNDEAAEAFTAQTGIKTYKWDVANYESCAKGIETVTRDFGHHPEVLVNNAGVTRDAMLHKMDIGDWHKVIEINLTSCFNMSHAVIPAMRENNFGRIVNISSVNALAGQIGQTNYAAAKAGMLGFTKSLARESAIKGITVNAVAPGYTNTDMVAAAPKRFVDNIISQIPVGRLGEPEEIARAVSFLVADEAGFITGETISVNGGHHME